MKATIAIADQVTTVVSVCIFISPSPKGSRLRAAYSNFGRLGSGELGEGLNRHRQNEGGVDRECGGRPFHHQGHRLHFGLSSCRPGLGGPARPAASSCASVASMWFALL